MAIEASRVSLSPSLSLSSFYLSYRDLEKYQLYFFVPRFTRRTRGRAWAPRRLWIPSSPGRFVATLCFARRLYGDVGDPARHKTRKNRGERKSEVHELLFLRSPFLFGALFAPSMAGRRRRRGRATEYMKPYLAHTSYSAATTTTTTATVVSGLFYESLMNFQVDTSL